MEFMLQERREVAGLGECAGEIFFRPSGAGPVMAFAPTPYGVGCILSPLRGYSSGLHQFRASPISRFANSALRQLRRFFQVGAFPISGASSIPRFSNLGASSIPRFANFGAFPISALRQFRSIFQFGASSISEQLPIRRFAAGRQREFRRKD
jgi:hypothetical protein